MYRILGRFASFVLLLSLYVIDVPLINAQSRVFTSCEAVLEGMESAVLAKAIPQLTSVCQSRGPPAEAEAAFDVSGVDIELTTSVNTTTGPSARASVRATGTGDIVVSASSFGDVPFTVPGSEAVEPSASSGSSTVGTESAFFFETVTRPPGFWLVIVSVSVRASTSKVWSAFEDQANFFLSGLTGLGVIDVIDLGGGEVRVKLNTGSSVTFQEEDLSSEDLYRVSRFTSIIGDVFPGYNFEKSKMYVQVSTRSRRTTIELGWSLPEDFSFGGSLTTGLRLIESFFLQILSNYEGIFGQICDAGRNIRTVEGDCNNLNDVTRGAAGKPLLRFGPTDPAYPNGNPSIPSGPTNINAREISNALFSTSPGASILEEQVDKLDGTCETTVTDGGVEIEVCLFTTVTVDGTTIVPFEDFVFDDAEQLTLRFSSGSCTIDIRLQCSGETSFDLEDDPCGAETNRFFSPVGCVITPAQDAVLANSAGLTDLFFSFGQFIDHDLGLSPLSQINPVQPGFSAFSRTKAEESSNSFPIEIPEDDFHFKRDKFEFTRAELSKENPLSQVNLHSSYLDGSQIYGVDFPRSRLLRSFENGQLALSDGNLPPFNKISGDGALGAVIANAPNADGRFFAVGDARGNEQTLLTSLHIIFLREHNLVAQELAALFPFYDDEKLYQTARAIVIAEYQSIVFTEWLPLLLGDNAPSADDFSYDEGIDVSTAAIFSTSAFRVGHTMVGTNLMRLGSGPMSSAEMSLIPIRDVFFQPDLIIQHGVEPFLRGAAWHKCKEIDNQVVDEVRNFLITDFPEGKKPMPFDLVSLNLQRGRDIGLPSFNDIREIYGLKRYGSFSEFVQDPNLANLASQIYEGDVDIVDSFFGGLAEEHVAESQLGQTFNKIIAEQFERLRDGDRFFYKGLIFAPEVTFLYPRLRAILGDEVKLKDIIIRNTAITQSELGQRDSVFQI